MVLEKQPVKIFVLGWEAGVQLGKLGCNLGANLGVHLGKLGVHLANLGVQLRNLWGAT